MVLNLRPTIRETGGLVDQVLCVVARRNASARVPPLVHLADPHTTDGTPVGVVGLVPRGKC